MPGRAPRLSTHAPRELFLARLAKIARGHGGVLLSTRYVNEDTRMRFRCAAGHVFEQRPGSTVSGKWCTACGIQRNAEAKVAEGRERLYRVVAERGGKVVSSDYVGSQTRMRYRCAEGHEWKTTPNSIVGGSWCPRCAVATRTPTARFREARSRIEGLVRKRGGVLLAPYRNYRVRLSIRCAQGHTWLAPVQGIEEGAWCPQCRRDALLIEMRALAEREGGACLSPGCRSQQQRLLWRCAVGHEFRKTGVSVKAGSWCGRCRGIAPGNLERMRRIAHERGGACLSTRYVDAATRLRFRCREGHVFMAMPSIVVHGHWCKECARWSPHSRRRLTIEHMRTTAAERGGRCLSREYVHCKVRLRWRCARGHEWMALPCTVRQGSWCAICSHSARGTLDGMRALAVERGGRLVSRAWDNHQMPLQFECARGHRFSLLGAAVKSGAWCPRCAPLASRPRAVKRRGLARQKVRRA